MFQILSSAFVGVIAGVFSSFLFVWLLYTYMSPKIKFTKNIYKNIDSSVSSGYLYRIGIKNVRPRDAVNLQIKCIIAIPDFPKDQIMTIHYVGLSTDHIMEIPPRFTRYIFLDFNTDLLVEYTLKYMHSIKLVEAAQQRNILPEHFYDRYPDAYLRFSIYLSDGYTGFSRLYRSKKFKIFDFSEYEYGGYD